MEKLLSYLISAVPFLDSFPCKGHTRKCGNCIGNVVKIPGVFVDFVFGMLPF